MNKIINITDNRLEDDSAVFENINLKNIPPNLKIDVAKNNLKHNAAIFKNTENINENELKQKLYKDISEKMLQFAEWSDEYQKLQQMKREISKRDSSLKDIMKKFGKDITQGCLINVLSQAVIQLLKGYF